MGSSILVRPCFALYPQRGDGRVVARLGRGYSTCTDPARRTRWVTSRRPFRMTTSSEDRVPFERQISTVTVASEDESEVGTMTSSPGAMHTGALLLIARSPRRQQVVVSSLTTTSKAFVAPPDI